MKPSLRNGLTSHGAEEAGKIGNGYTLTSNGHVCDIVSIYSNVTVRAPLYALCQSSGNCDHLVLFFVRLALTLPINPVHRSLSSHMVKFYCWMYDHTTLYSQFSLPWNIHFQLFLKLTALEKASEIVLIKIRDLHAKNLRTIKLR